MSNTPRKKENWDEEDLHRLEINVPSPQQASPKFPQLFLSAADSLHKYWSDLMEGSFMLQGMSTRTQLPIFTRAKELCHHQKLWIQMSCKLKRNPCYTRKWDFLNINVIRFVHHSEGSVSVWPCLLCVLVILSFIWEHGLTPSSAALWSQTCRRQHRSTQVFLPSQVPVTHLVLL